MLLKPSQALRTLGSKIRMWWVFPWWLIWKPVDSSDHWNFQMTTDRPHNFKAAVGLWNGKGVLWLMFLNFREIQWFYDLHYVSVHTQMFGTWLSSVIWVSSPKMGDARIGFSSIGRTGRLHLVLIPNLLEPEKAMLSIPGNPEGRRCSLLFPQGDSSPRIGRPQLTKATCTPS